MVQVSDQFLKFLAVGGVGFVVDAGVLTSLVALGLPAIPARVLSFAVAVSVTWVLNRHWTFVASVGAEPREFRMMSRYFAVQTFGTLCNFAVFSLLISQWTETPWTAFVALAAGSAVGLVVNFTGARWLVFGEAGR